MKKLILLVMVMVVLSICNIAYAFDSQKFITETQNIQKEYQILKGKCDLRDFDFILKMALVQINACNEDMEKHSSQREKLYIAKSYIAILSAQYISLEKYITYYIIPKNKNPQNAEKQCQKLLHHIRAARSAIR